MSETKYEPVIGLEVHLELHLEEKIFCATPGRFGEAPNTLVCPETLGLPGSLPVVNEDAVLATIRAGLALDCEIAEFTKFDRKHYYYPDLPKGYQISQYDLPLCSGGKVTIPAGENGETRSIRITRVHLEEDTGKLLHQDGSSQSLVDLNRAGIALVEIVSEPDVRSAAEAVAYLRELKGILEYLDISDCNMEEGSLRCEPNVSVRPVGADRLGTKTEIKNLNSFKVVQAAVDYEIRRQIEQLERGKPVRQETRLWNEDAQRTETMRTKEEAEDYRYFPDPDIPPLMISPQSIKQARASLPAPPRERRRRLVELGVPDYNAEIIVRSRGYTDFFERCLAAYREPHRISNLLIGELLQELNERGIAPDRIAIPPQHLADYCRMLDDGTMGKAARRQVLAAMLDSGKSPQELVEELGVSAVSDRAELEGMVEGVLAANEKIVAQIREGKTSAIMALVGQVMKASRGRANPQMVQELLKEKLGVD